MYKNIPTYQDCDHITLYSSTATRDGARYTFDIPYGKWASNERGGLCTVELANGIGITDAAETTVQVVQYVSGSPNAFTHTPGEATAGKIPLDYPVLATGAQSHNVTPGLIFHPTAPFITPARPQQIVLDIGAVNKAGTIAAPETDNAFVLTLKYTYWDPTSSAVNQKDFQNYKTL